MQIVSFRRIEKKYLLTARQKETLLARIGSRLTPDIHGESTIFSLYLDTPDHLLIRNSIDADVYKEKLRLRSYGVPQEDTPVFLELKKKFDGVVYKRREVMPLGSARDYLRGGRKPTNSQIMEELDYAMRLYHRPKPAMLIMCERTAFYAEAHPDLRLTFDAAIRYREDKLAMEAGSQGKQILPDGMFLLEVKTGGAMPLWLADALDACRLYPVSYSKYGAAYLDTLRSARQADPI